MQSAENEPESYPSIRIFHLVKFLTEFKQKLVLETHSLTHSRTSQDFMELEGSLPCSQEPSTDPYPEPDRSSPYHPILSL
jgi:hypothetical protein